MKTPDPTPIFRITHIGNLSVLLKRGGLHAANFTPVDGLEYRTIHHTNIQITRHATQVPCGPKGTAHDYVPFYFGAHSPMLYVLKQGGVEGYSEGQRPLIYLATTAQAVEQAGIPFVFTDGHAAMAFTGWFSELTDLDRVDWDATRARYWKDTPDDMDRKRKKQAEFLVHEFLPWDVVVEVGVFDKEMKSRVEHEIARHDPGMKKTVRIQRGWYY